MGFDLDKKLNKVINLEQKKAFNFIWVNKEIEKINELINLKIIKRVIIKK